MNFILCRSCKYFQINGTCIQFVKNYPTELTKLNEINEINEKLARVNEKLARLNEKLYGLNDKQYIKPSDCGDGAAYRA